MVNIEGILAPESQAFIAKYSQESPADIMLGGRGAPGVALVDLVNQIKARQQAKNKLSYWNQQPGIVYPESIYMQQSSSELTGIFKSNLVSGDHLVDMTGGLGVDSYYFSKRFERVTYIDSSEQLCQLAKHNFNVLGASHIQVVQGDCETILSELPTPTVIYIDPSRRKDDGSKVFRLEMCEPNLLRLIPKLWHRKTSLLLKLSPLIDITRALNQISHVHHVHVVSVKNDCKEVLLMAKSNYEGPITMTATDIQAPGVQSSFTFTLEGEQKTTAIYEEPLEYLYEPFTSVLKAGAFKTLTTAFPVCKLHANSHLYTSDKLIEDFPGRKFKINGVSAYKETEVSKLIPEGKANITVRNFPYTVQEIRKATGIKEGGERYLFATRLISNKLALIAGHRIT